MQSYLKKDYNEIKLVFRKKIQLLRDNKLLPQKFNSPLIVSWDITNKCNLNCLFCYNKSHAKWKETLPEEKLTIAKKISQMEPLWVCLCGGEPLMVKELPFIIEVLSSGKTQISMVTNGWFLNRAYLKILKKAGLRALQFSLDGIKPTTHDRLRRRNGSFQRVVEAIKLAVAEGFFVEVAFCPTKLNYKEFPEVVEFVFNLGAKGIRTQPLMILGRAKEYKRFLQMNEKEEKEFEKLVMEEVKKNRKGFTIDYGEPIVHFFTFPLLPTLFLHINSNGDVKISPYLPFIYGNLIKESWPFIWAKVQEAWQTEKVQAIIRNIHTTKDLAYLGEQ